MENSTTASVTRRRVFYIPGYDPVHPRRYRELYRSQGAKQSEISGYNLMLSGRPTGKGNYSWNVQTQIKEKTCTTDIEVLVWSDIVRSSMRTGVLATYWQLVATSWTYIYSGALGRLMQLRAGPVIAALYPILFLLVQLCFAFGIAGLTGWIVSFVYPSLAILGVGAVPAVVLWFRKNDNRFYAYYLMHDYAYSAQSKGAIPADLDARMAQFVDTIAMALTDDLDEVLIVGHSSGAHLGVSILADLIRLGKVSEGGPQLAFLSLGHVVPMVSFLPDAWRLRADLQFLGATDKLTWVDVTAPSDGCAFALCHPVHVSSVGDDTTHLPLVISAAFSQTLSPQMWSEIKRRYFRIHFQYLCAFDRPRDYDYFQITAGPKTLKDRFCGRKPSPSTITKAVSKYQSTAP